MPTSRATLGPLLSLESSQRYELRAADPGWYRLRMKDSGVGLDENVYFDVYNENNRWVSSWISDFAPSVATALTAPMGDEVFVRGDGAGGVTHTPGASIRWLVDVWLEENWLLTWRAEIGGPLWNQADADVFFLGCNRVHESCRFGG